VLVNNAGRAGIVGYAAIEEVDVEAWNLLLASNATSVMLGMKHVAPAMRAAGGGAIVNVASIYAMVGTTNNTAYHASKGAVRAVSRAAAVQLAPAGIRVNTVFPGYIETPAVAEQLARPEARQARIDATPLGRIGTADDVARAILYLASDEAGFVTGAELVIDGGVTAQ
jgi:NAD(P)-dependent dehydrogenase (short-subunit alcohol dehydrogenase family)